MPILVFDRFQCIILTKLQGFLLYYITNYFYWQNYITNYFYWHDANTALCFEIFQCIILTKLQGFLFKGGSENIHKYSKTFNSSIKNSTISLSFSRLFPSQIIWYVSQDMTCTFVPTSFGHPSQIHPSFLKAGLFLKFALRSTILVLILNSRLVSSKLFWRK